MTMVSQSITDAEDFAQQKKSVFLPNNLPLTEEGGTLIEESDLDMDELSEIYRPDDEKEI